jgi:hypothetical protein
MASTQFDCHCIEGLFHCPFCKNAAERRYSEAFPRSLLLSAFVGPSEAEELRHLENYGTYSLHVKVFGNAANSSTYASLLLIPKVGDTCAWPMILQSTSYAGLCRRRPPVTDAWSSKPRTTASCLIDGRSIKSCSKRGDGIIKYQYHVLFKRVAFNLSRYYKEDVLDILDEDPTVQLQHSFLCFRMLLDLFEEPLQRQFQQLHFPKCLSFSASPHFPSTPFSKASDANVVHFSVVF